MIKKRKTDFWIYFLFLIGAFGIFTLSCSDDGVTKPADIETGTVEDIDGNIYKTVVLGEQEWMAENLRTTRYADGTEIITGLSNIEWRNTEEGACAVYPHDNVDGIVSEAGMAEAYGKLYNWYAVDDSRGLCPEGWHVPDDDEWKTLEDYLLNAYDLTNYQNDVNGLGNALKSCRQADSPMGGECSTDMHPRWYPHNTHYGIDKFGFAGLPAGDRSHLGSFYYIGGYGWWWSSSTADHDNTLVWYRDLQHSSGRLNRHNTAKTFGYSVRCVREH